MYPHTKSPGPSQSPLLFFPAWRMWGKKSNGGNATTGTGPSFPPRTMRRSQQVASWPDTCRGDQQVLSSLKTCQFFPRDWCWHWFLKLDQCLALEVPGVAQLVTLCQQLYYIFPQWFHHQACSRLNVISILAISGRKIQTRDIENPGKALGRGRQVWDPTLAYLAC